MNAIRHWLVTGVLSIGVLVGLVSGCVSKSDRAPGQPAAKPASSVSAIAVTPVMQSNVNRSYRAGVKIAFGTFTNEFVRNLPYQAATAVSFGLPYEEALKAVTINPAEIWGHGQEIGSVEKGKWADLMIVSGDPLEIQTEIKHIYIKGREVELSNRQTQLYQKYLNRP